MADCFRGTTHPLASHRVPPMCCWQDTDTDCDSSARLCRRHDWYRRKGTIRGSQSLQFVRRRVVFEGK
jgi:hypothetical protein